MNPARREMDSREAKIRRAFELIKQLTPEQLAEALRVALAADHKEATANEQNS